eukprot:6177604-Pleurochrysis_carterae.AAC.1
MQLNSEACAELQADADDLEARLHEATAMEQTLRQQLGEMRVKKVRRGPRRPVWSCVRPCCSQGASATSVEVLSLRAQVAEARVQAESAARRSARLPSRVAALEQTRADHARASAELVARREL